MRYYVSNLDKPERLFRFDKESQEEGFFNEGFLRWEPADELLDFMFQGEGDIDPCPEAFARLHFPTAFMNPLPTPNEVIQKAYDLAAQAHAGQTRDGKLPDGSPIPYLTHPVKVASGFTDWRLIATALLHDVLEDSKGYTEQTLLDAGIPPLVVTAVKCLTIPGDCKEEAKYLAHIREHVLPNQFARLVKIADIRANLGDAPKEKNIPKYLKALDLLGSV
jgi:hypothetical protein